VEESLRRFWEAVCDELLAAYHLFNDADTPFIRRTFVRTAFAVIEGVISFLKAYALSKLPSEDVTPAEAAMLREESFTLDDRGRAQVQPKFVPLDTNIRFAFSMFGRAVGRKIELDTSGPEWRQFRAAITVRNRLVHPRGIRDLEVSDEELECARAAANWILIVLVKALVAQVRELREEEERLRRRLKQS